VRALTLALGLTALCSVGVASAIELRAANPWIQSAASGQPTTPAYVDIRTDTAVKLIGASTAFAESVEIVDAAEHALPSVEIAAGGQLRLAPGGSHLALRGIKRGFGNGDTVLIKLRFEDAAHRPHTVDVNAEARGMMAPRPRYTE
jgi:copper(I)-binding protein